MPYLQKAQVVFCKQRRNHIWRATIEPLYLGGEEEGQMKLSGLVAGTDMGSFGCEDT